MRIQRRQVVEQRAVLDVFHADPVDGVHLQEGEKALLVLGRAHLARHRVPLAQAELLDLRRGDVNVVRPRQVVVIRATEEPETVLQDLQDALVGDHPGIAGLGLQDFGDELLLAQAGDGARFQLFGHLDQLGHGGFAERGRVQLALGGCGGGCLLWLHL